MVNKGHWGFRRVAVVWRRWLLCSSWNRSSTGTCSLSSTPAAGFASGFIGKTTRDGPLNPPDLRWLDLTVRAESFVNLPAELLHRPADLPAEKLTTPIAPSRSGNWWWLTSLPVALGLVRFLRQRARATR